MSMEQIDSELGTARQAAGSGELPGSSASVKEMHADTDAAAVWTQPEWKILSLLLSYPGDETYSELIEETAEWADEIGSDEMVQLVAEFRDSDVDSLVSEYVQYFDFQSNTCLYMTAHELGDSRKRGVALVALRRMLAAAGWEQDESELPDYLPLLFEFLAAKSSEFDTKDVEIRLGRVCKVIAGKLPAETVYQKLFTAAVKRLPEVPIPENGIVFTGNETTDLDELPYPVFYE